MLMFQYLCAFRYIVYDKKKLHSMYVLAVDILAQLSDAAHLPFVLFPVFFIVLCIFFCFRLFLLSRLCLIVLFNIHWGLFLSGIKISAQYRKKELTEFFPKSFSCCS